ncbi:MAG TPA: alkaline phosphatase family protein [Chitinophagales bacterium]|nr:alkaline phosphatase family protein [Chitinophagales bacterium]HNL84354.1 alkaline phosphatase family protein [Chitinophagales bacterium]
MYKHFIFILIIFIFNILGNAKNPSNTQRPKLVVGIVVDQMRWDYLYRYKDRYTKDGFLRLINSGFNCEQTFIPYTPTVTAAGHASIYTGSVPAINGITGNNFYEYNTKQSLYCTQDDSVLTVGANNNNGKMSPKNMLTTTIGDELQLAQNFKGKVIGISIKDRGAILPAGHSATAAYWYDNKTGNFISSTYYMQALPDWVNAFNSLKKADDYYNKGWTTLFPANTYTNSDTDMNSYESAPFGSEQVGLPYSFTSILEKKNYGALRVTPYGNSITFDFARETIIKEKLGKSNITDMLAVSFSSTDYIGHTFGPNSVEMEDTYLRFDKELSDFISFLDQQIGKNNYTLFLTADHGAAHIPAYLKTKKIPAGGLALSKVEKQMNEHLRTKFAVDSLVLAIENYQVFFDKEKLKQHAITLNDVMQDAVDFLIQYDEIDRVLDYTEIAEETLPDVMKSMFTNGYYPNRCGQLLLVLKPSFIDDEYGSKGTTHGLWNPYDAHIPLLFYGKNIQKGKSTEKVFMTDIAPTICTLLHIQMPNGCIGNVIEGVEKK